MESSMTSPFWRITKCDLAMLFVIIPILFCSISGFTQILLGVHSWKVICFSSPYNYKTLSHNDCPVHAHRLPSHHSHPNILIEDVSNTSRQHTSHRLQDLQLSMQQ
jgi:hypothetical protein